MVWMYPHAGPDDEKKRADRLVERILSGYPLSQVELHNWCVESWRLDHDLKHGFWKAIKDGLMREDFLHIRREYIRTARDETRNLFQHRERFRRREGEPR